LTFLSSKRGRGGREKVRCKKKKEKDRGGGVGIRKNIYKNENHNTQHKAGPAQANEQGRRYTR
jgi:hypothetical protein